MRQIRNSILYRKDIGNENVVILGLVEACQMHKIISPDREERKRLKKELKIIIKKSPIADAVNKAIKQVQAEVIASITAASIAATANSSH